MARLAAERITPTWASTLQSVVDKAADATSETEFRHAFISFHETIIRSTGDRVLELFVHALHDVYTTRRARGQ